jgi:uncharacterized protein (DUF2252 family)
VEYNRRFADRSGVRRLDDGERDRVESAFAAYLDTVPESKKEGVVMFDVLDVVGREGFGVGSAGLPTYNVLIEGFSQALDNDIVLSLKQGNVAAPSRVVRDEEVSRFFRHHGHRTAVSQRALQAHADRFLGWTELPGHDGSPTGFVVSEQSPYEADLDWAAIDEPEQLHEVVQQLGQATAKIHCVDDDDAEHDLVQVSVEHVIADCVGEDVDGLVRDLQEFAHRYAGQVREDHAAFVDAFRGGAFAEVSPA